MLREIHFKNYALLDDLSLSFDSGFSVITGETGAGKSIIVEAIALLMGGRSDLAAIRHEHDESLLEARFDAPLGETPENALILKRILSRSKGRAYLNGALANLAMLQQLGINLVEIHGQHDQQNLTHPEYQLALLDAYAKNSDIKQQYQTLYKKRLELMKTMSVLQQNTPNTQKQEEMLRYQLAEITQAHLEVGEDVRLMEEEQRLKNWEAMLTAVEGGQTTLSEEGGLLNQLGTVEQHLRDLNQVTQDAASEIELLNHARIHLKELALLLRNRKDHIAYDPERQNQVTERLYLIQKMKKRYGDSIEAICDKARQIELELQGLAEHQQHVAELKEAFAQNDVLLTHAAKALSFARTKAMPPLEKKVKEEINGLGMDTTDFTIMRHEKPFSEDGGDAIEFLIALPGEPLRPLARIASGGELSRLILAIKVTLTEADHIPTLIFDEIDAGISGAVAEHVGRSLFRLARRHQVFCVTHLPQVARFAHHHYKVEKKVVHRRTVTVMHKLTQEEKVMELARLLGGITITHTTRRHAEELVDAAGER